MSIRLVGQLVGCCLTALSA